MCRVKSSHPLFFSFPVPSYFGSTASAEKQKASGSGRHLSLYDRPAAQAVPKYSSGVSTFVASGGAAAHTVHYSDSDDYDDSDSDDSDSDDSSVMSFSDASSVASRTSQASAASNPAPRSSSAASHGTCQT